MGNFFQDILVALHDAADTDDVAAQFQNCGGSFFLFVGKNNFFQLVNLGVIFVHQIVAMVNQFRKQFAEQDGGRRHFFNEQG